MSDTPYPAPAVVARTDQARAHLNDLVAQVREHHHHDDCKWPTLCHGRAVRDALYDMCPHQMEELLIVALLQLANRTTDQKG